MDTIKIPPSTRGALLKFVEQSMKEKKARLEDLYEDIEILEKEVDELKDLKEQIIARPKEESGKKSKSSGKISSLRDAIRVSLKEKSRLLSTDEFLNLISELRPDFLEGKSRRDQITSVSASLSGMYNTNELDRIKNPNEQGYLYGFSDWFNEKRKPKEEYLRNTLNAGYKIPALRDEYDLLL